MRDQVQDRLAQVEEKQAEQIVQLEAITTEAFAPEQAPWCYSDETSEILTKSAVTLQRWRSSGYGPAWHKNGSRVVYKREDLYKWMLGEDGDHGAVTRAPTPSPTPAPEAQKKAAPQFSMKDGRRAVRSGA